MGHSSENGVGLGLKSTDIWPNLGLVKFQNIAYQCSIRMADPFKFSAEFFEDKLFCSSFVDFLCFTGGRTRSSLTEVEPFSCIVLFRCPLLLGTSDIMKTHCELFKVLRRKCQK